METAADIDSLFRIVNKLSTELSVVSRKLISVEAELIRVRKLSGHMIDISEDIARLKEKY